MDENERKERAKAIIEKMRGDRGYMLPEWEFGAERDPAYFEAYSHMAPVTFADGQVLPGKYRELVHIGILCFRMAPMDAVHTHMRSAMEKGASGMEIQEALETASISGGLPTLHYGLRALMTLGKKD